MKTTRAAKVNKDAQIVNLCGDLVTFLGSRAAISVLATKASMAMPVLG